MYKSGCWSGLKRQAGVLVPPPGPHEDELGRSIERLLHLDDPLRIAAYLEALAPHEAGASDQITRRLQTGLHFGMIPDRLRPASLEETRGLLLAHPAVADELRELLPLLDDLSDRLTFSLDDDLGWEHRIPLSVHARHTMDDVLTAFGLLDVGRPFWKQTGVVRDETTNSDLFFVTLEKSERDYSPSTLYKDYAISPVLFHWESQSGTTRRSPTGQRYIHHRERGGHILLFVRQRRHHDGRTMPYTLLGAADHVSHQGDRPISFVWRRGVRHPLGRVRRAADT